MASDAPKTKDIRLRFRGLDISNYERKVDAIGKAIGHPDEPEVVVLAALALLAGHLNVGA